MDGVCLSVIVTYEKLSLFFGLIVTEKTYTYRYNSKSLEDLAWEENVSIRNIYANVFPTMI